MNGASSWRTLWSLVATVGIGLGVLEWGPGVALGCFAAVTVVAVIGVVAVRSVRASRLGVSDDWWSIGVWGTAAVLAAGVFACWAFARLAPSLALLLLTLALVTSPVAVRCARRLLGRRATPTGQVVVRRTDPAPSVVRHVPDAPSPTPSPTRPRPEDLDDLTLCRVWRQSYWELRSQSTWTDYLQVITWRQCCLDEIERRNARALHAWLESGARASGGPEKFLRHPPRGTDDVA